MGLIEDRCKVVTVVTRFLIPVHLHNTYAHQLSVDTQYYKVTTVLIALLCC